jgi:hypothetical protein
MPVNAMKVCYKKIEFQLKHTFIHVPALLISVHYNRLLESSISKSKIVINKGLLILTWLCTVFASSFLVGLLRRETLTSTWRSGQPKQYLCVA